MTKAEVTKLVAVMCAAFPAAKVTADTCAIYERMLADLDYPVANAAVEQLLAIQRFMPTVAEIRARCFALSLGEVKAGGEAWGVVVKAIGRYGRNRTPGVDFQFPDPVVGECVRALGWGALCDSEMQSADRARFIELYDTLAQRARNTQLGEGLPALQRFRALQAGQDQQRVASPANDNAPTPIGQLVKLTLPEDS